MDGTERLVGLALVAVLFSPIAMVIALLGIHRALCDILVELRKKGTR